MIDRKKAKLTNQETENVISSFFAGCDDLEDCLNYFDEVEAAEAAAKKEFAVMINNMRLRAVALVCTKDANIMRVVSTSKHLGDFSKEDVKLLLKEILERSEHWGPFNVRETAIKLCQKWLKQYKEA